MTGKAVKPPKIVKQIESKADTMPIDETSHEVMMHHADGRATEVHKDSVETMKGLGWLTQKAK